MEKTFDDIIYIWKSELTKSLPAVEEIISSARKNLAKLKTSILIEVSTLLLALVTIAWVSSVFRFQYLSTYFGLTLMFFTVAVYSYLRIRQLLFLRKINVSSVPRDYSAELMKFQQAQQKVNTTYYTWYVILLNLSFGLYFYEVLFRSGLRTTWQFAAVIIYIAWMLAAIYYIILIKSKKEKERTNQLIKKLDQLQDSLSAEEKLL